MNERIKELVKQSGGEFWQRLENDVVNPEAYITFDPPESLEKFAELIVRECMSISSKAMTNDNWPPHMIAKHFGVEE
jgi:hypothetical protein